MTIIKNILKTSLFLVVFLLISCGDQPTDKIRQIYINSSVNPIKLINGDPTKFRPGIAPYSVSIDLIELTKEHAKFKLVSSSYYSNPDVKLSLDRATMQAGGKQTKCFECEAISLSGTVNPKNGNTKFDEVEFEFKNPGVQNAVVTRREAMTSFMSFTVHIPIRVVNQKSFNDKSDNTSSKYISETMEFNFLLNSAEINPRTNFLRGLYSAY